MLEEVKKILLLGIGAASITYEKSMDIINEMVNKGKITLDEGKQLGEELRKEFKEKNSLIKENEKNSNKRYLVKEDVLKIIAEYNLISRIEFDTLQEKVNELEKEIKKLK